MIAVKVEAALVIVHGRVQGVGYRSFAQRRAQERGLRGYAVNTHGGEVKVHVEGSHEAIQAYVRDLEQGPPLARVERVSITPMPYTGRYAEFSVRYSEAR